MDDLRVAVIGYGLAGASFHAPVIAATPGLRLATIVTSNAERAAAARAHHEAVEIVPAVEDLWVRPDRHDLVVVAAHNRAHVPPGLAAIEAGLPVVIDKPVAPGSNGAERLCAAARVAQVPVVPFHNRRWDGDFLTLRRLLSEDELGDVLRYESRFERWRPMRRAGARREQPGADDAGGVLFDLGTHLIDQALALFGPVVAVYAETETRQPGLEVDDDAFVALAHASGVRSHLWASHTAADRGPRLRVLGSRAAYVKHGMDVQALQLQAGMRPGDAGFGEEPREAWGALGAGEQSRPVPTAPGDYARFYADVAATVRHGTAPPVSLDDAIHGLRIIEAAFVSIPLRVEFTDALRPLLERFGTNPKFHLVLFTLDESVFSRELAPLAGFYPSVFLGAPWWFLDAPEAIRRFRAAVTETAGFSRTAGFVDDTRAFCSIPARHDMSRRIDAGFLAGLVAEYRLDEEEAVETAVDLVTGRPTVAFKL